MRWYKIFDLGQLQQPGIFKVQVAGKTLCAVVANKQVQVLAARCPHAGADLSTGWRDGEYLICPRHRYGYDLQTGRGKPGQGDYVPIYPTQTRADGVYVGIKSWWSW